VNASASSLTLFIVLEAYNTLFWFL
jgi:hypothetical protein